MPAIQDGQNPSSDRIDMTEVWVCLSGGNALGAFHVGAWQAIEASNLRVTRLSGASIGAVVAALIAGNAPDRRDAALHEFLARIAATRPFLGRRAAVAGTLAHGHPALFLPSWPGLSEILPGMPADRSAFHRRPMRRLLERLIDFDRLNDAGIEVIVTALDAESGQVAEFRNTRTALTVDHLMAATALPVLFRPVAIDGRLFVDAGLRERRKMNLPPG